MSQVADSNEVTVVISDEAYAILKDIAEKYGIGLPEALARALSHEQLIATQVKEGGRLLVETKNNVLREVVTG